MPMLSQGGAQSSGSHGHADSGVPELQTELAATAGPIPGHNPYTGPYPGGMPLMHSQVTTVCTVRIKTVNHCMMCQYTALAWRFVKQESLTMSIQEC